MPERRLWRFRAANTHLYPGARLRLVEGGAAAAEVADAVQIEFSDLGCVSGRIAAGSAAQRLEIALTAHRTARGTAVSAKSWFIEPLAGRAGEWRVAARTAPVLGRAAAPGRKSERGSR